MFNLSRSKVSQAVFVSLVLGSAGICTPVALATSIVSPAQPQEQTVPCKPDNSNCPWKKIKDRRLPSSSTQHSVTLPQEILPQENVASKAGNPCKPSSTSAKCRDWILGNPTPPIRPKR